MPGKVNPVMSEMVMQVAAQVIGNDTAITIGGMQGNFELNVRIPLIARNLLQSIALLSSASRMFADKCVVGIEANKARNQWLGDNTLAMATALNPYIGYDRAAAIVKDATASGRSLREVAREHGVDDATLDAALDLRKMAEGGIAQVPAKAPAKRAPTRGTPAKRVAAAAGAKPAARGRKA
jgi:fumarate hydratase class II